MRMSACVDMNTKNETDRTELEKKIVRYRSSARLTSDDLTQKRIAMLVSEIELALLWQIVDFAAFYRIPESIFQ